MKRLILLSALLTPTVHASEQETLNALQAELRYLHQQVAEAVAANYQGEATGGARHFDYARLQQDIERWQQALQRYRQTPRRQPFDVNGYHQRSNGTEPAEKRQGRFSLSSQ